MSLTENLSDSETSGSNSSGFSALQSLYLLPLVMAGVYAFVHKAALLSAAGTLGAFSALGVVAVHALWIVGAFVVTFYGIFAVINVVALIGAIVFREGILLGIALLGAAWFGASVFVAQTWFGQFALLVSFTFGATVVGWALIALIVLALGIVGIIGLGVM